MKLLNGKQVAEEISKDLKQTVEQYATLGYRKPKLVVIQIGADSASQVYIKNKQNKCKQLGIECKIHNFDDTITQVQLINFINVLNNDDTVDGMLVQLPLPNHIDERVILQKISPLKDVDGFHPMNVGKLATKQRSLIPCTAKGVIDLLKYYNIELAGKHVVIIGRSNIVGKPLISLFINNNATVTVCHSKTENIKKITKQADILVVAIGQANYVDKTFIKKDCVVIDVGINRVDDKICGDVDFESVKDIVSYITPVPRGVGPMTIISLMANVLNVYEENININKENNIKTEIVDFGELKQGDRIIGSTGTPVVVDAVYEEHIPERMYEIKMEDNQVIKCSGNHLWYCENDDDRKNKKRYIKLAKYYNKKELHLLNDTFVNESIPLIEIVKKLAKTKKGREFIILICESLGHDSYSPHFIMDNPYEKIKYSEIYNYNILNVIKAIKHCIDVSVNNKKGYFYFGKVRTTDEIYKNSHLNFEIPTLKDIEKYK